MVGLGRLELPTSRLSGVRSNHLSYKPMSTGAPPYSRMRVGMSTRGEDSSPFGLRMTGRAQNDGTGSE